MQRNTLYLFVRQREKSKFAFQKYNARFPQITSKEDWHDQLCLVGARSMNYSFRLSFPASLKSQQGHWLKYFTHIRIIGSLGCQSQQ